MRISKSKSHFVVVAVMVLLSCTIGSKYTCRDISENYYIILDNFKKGNDPNILIPKLQKVLNKKPNCIYANLLLGDLYIIIKKNEFAIKHFSNALEVNPSSVYALFKLGLLYNLEKKYDSAIILYRTSASLKAQNGFVFEYTEGYNKITNTVSFDIPYKEIIYNNAIASFNIGNMTDALSEIKYSIDHGANITEAEFLRGKIYLKMNDKSKACDDFFASKMRGVLEAQHYIDKNCKDK